MILVVGCGNPDRGDDAAGVLVVRALRDRLPAGVHAVEAGLDLSPLLDHWTGYSHIVLVDAVSTGAPTGTVHRWTAPDLPDFAARNTHGLSVRELISLAQTLFGGLTALSVIGIEVAHLEIGSALTPPVERAIREVAHLLTNL